VKPSASPTGPQYIVDPETGGQLLAPSRREMRMARELGERLKREKAAKQHAAAKPSRPARLTVVAPAASVASAVPVAVVVPADVDAAGGGADGALGGDSGDDDDPEPPGVTRPRGRALRRARRAAR
jgi:hypothetical protein